MCHVACVHRYRSSYAPRIPTHHQPCKGEIVTATIDPSGRSLALEMADSTTLATTGRIIVKGLPPGNYTISYGKKRETRAVTEALVLEWPLKESREIKIAG